jgi:hypothetical protein
MIKIERKYYWFGFWLSALHFLVTWGLLFYFGMTMTNDGVGFVKNVIMQPGISIYGLLLMVTGKTFNFIPQVFNLVFYTWIFALIFSFFGKTRRQTEDL